MLIQTKDITIMTPSLAHDIDIDKYARALSSLFYDPRNDIYNLQIKTVKEVKAAILALDYTMNTYPFDVKPVIADDDEPVPPTFLEVFIDCKDGAVRLFLPEIRGTRDIVTSHNGRFDVYYFVSRFYMPTAWSNLHEHWRFPNNVTFIQRYVRETKGIPFKQAKRKFKYGNVDFVKLEKGFPDLVARFGQVYSQFVYTETPRNITVQLEDFVYANGAPYYLQRNSCWWDQYFVGAVCFEQNGGKAIRLFEEGKLIGRAWYWHGKRGMENGVMFNPYGLSYDEWAIVLKELFGAPVAKGNPNYIRVNRDNMFVNESYTAVVGKGYRGHIKTDEDLVTGYSYCDACDDRHIISQRIDGEWLCQACANMR